MLVNYWWAEHAALDGISVRSAGHAMLAVRSLVAAAPRDLARDWFDHDIFGAPENSAAHLPPHIRGVQSAPTAEIAARMRGYLLAELSRADRNSPLTRVVSTRSENDPSFRTPH